MTMTSYDFDQPVYLGDGLYASWDGYQVRLMANDQLLPTDVVYVNDEVALELIAYLKKCFKMEAK